ncbi:SEC-C domain-containing protein [Sabulilitoribacter arenilitoris]|uniref:SEC-C domain-containing protein n=1 Tax=Wocania arenilitoris TaxID=2044858 RepID=A0AAE3EKD1_9FLAO|nr:SEC-C metal-binding domain-containing protein [Wocania arenilitoris]MCF7566885.1 SEC-C domain-containing protein [Wocania arenilitoris]
MKSLKLHTLKISNDNTLLDKQNQLTPYISRLLEKLYHDIPKGKESTLKKLLKYTTQFPKVPIFKNYLMVFYAQKGNVQKANEVNKWIIKEHPEYLFAKINYANSLLSEEKYEDILNLLGTNLLLHELYPKRDEFLLDEIISYYAFTIRYLYHIDNEDEANTRLQILEDLDEDHHKVIQAQSFKQEYILKKFSLRYAEEEKNKIIVKPKDRKSHLQTTSPPKFHYPEQMGYLYKNTLDSISENQLNELINLDHKKLVEDLIKVLYDSIYRYDYFFDKIEEESQACFPIHAICILLFLKDNNSLNVVLEILKQDDDYIEFWFGYSLSEYVVPLLYHIGKNQKEKLIAFIKEEYIFCYNKSILTESFIKICAFDKTLENLEDILDFLISNKNNPGILDTEFNGLFIADLMDYGAIDLLPKIKEMYALKIVGEGVCGTYDDVKKGMYDEFGVNPVEDFNTLKQIYNTFTYKEEFENNLPEEYYRYSEPIISAKKIGRNDPCSCGSGKKHKKCCLNN